MNTKKNTSFNLNSIYKNKEFFYDEIIKRKNIWKTDDKLNIHLIILTFIYVFVMGIYQSVMQAAVAGLKVVVLFLGAYIVCFPSLYIVQFILGSKLRIDQMLGIILLGLLLIGIIMVSFSPVVVFFILTGGQYHFIQLIHVGIYIFSGIFGMWIILNALKYACEKKGVYPQIGVTIFRIWVIILAFVSIQLAWNLRPFMGKQNESFSFSRKYKGNFYTAIIYSIDQLSYKNVMKQNKKRLEDATPKINFTTNE